MGSESEAQAETMEEARLKTIRSTTPPKLSLFSRIPHQSYDPSAPTGMLTPPLRPPASVPFLWEEAPGKPLPTSTATSFAVARCLELPPRLQLTESSIFNNKIFSSSNRTLSPTTVLDGPYVAHGRSSSFTSSSFRRGGSPDDSEGDGMLHGQRRDISSSSRGYFGSWGRKTSYSSSKRNQVVGDCGFVISRSSSSSSSAVVLGVGIGEIGGGGTTNTKVKITRFKRNGSFLSLPYSKSSQFWASICQGLKQVVPWRNRKTKQNGTHSLIDRD
ncbi:uncharacterized protein At4g00950-like [Telopea speciosissima]|uniref:uncharacterized protein At4g00950-like n=1 Tax=Telopea speciosissima TaxID=54955 RepID=UPI001CC81F8F|nr:uncharacterized protein At4g00950-like [Telopea speciosissima]